MRADRLLAELALLQSRRRMTAAELAAELEVTERTIYRDMYALQVAGVPLIAERGRDGGYALYGDWRADLTGLTRSEMESLLVATAASPTSRSGPEAVTAVAKLAAMLPPEAAGELTGLRRRIHIVLDAEAGQATMGETAGRLIDALRTRRFVSLEVRRVRSGRVRRGAHPMGLVVDGRDWYLVWHDGDGRARVEALDRIEHVEVTDSPAIGEIDIAEAWQEWQVSRHAAARGLEARLKIDLGLLDHWCDRYPTEVVAEHADHAEVITVFGWVVEARAAVLPWGGAIEVLAPQSLRLAVADFAAQTTAVYADG
ncbi:MAG: WYL domain-containing protein [Acidimicrobiia bacterium]|nr:WYL domain-containing protein [Acidimicrobiia bacterium]